MSTENKRQISIRQKDSLDVSFSKLAIENDFVLYVYKKIEKLSTAVFLVTAHLEEQEVMRTDLRASVLSLIKKTNFNFEHQQKNISFVFYSADEEKNYYDETVSSLLKIKSLLCVGRDSFLLNQNNCNVLLKVITSLLDEISDQYSYQEKNNELQSTIFSEDFFTVDSPLVTSKESGQQSTSTNLDSFSPEVFVGSEDFFTKEKSATTDLSKKSEVENKEKRDDLSEKNIIAKTALSENNSQRNFKGDSVKKKTTTSGFKKEAKLKRQTKIVSIIKDKGSVGIKDIANQILDCSEKTIQRELIAMLDGGIIKKEGERRWSTYSIA